jgi:hypothetical protein
MNMCWYSAEHVGQALLQAEVGQRLCIRQMHWGDTRWVVREGDLQQKRPAPVCLLDGTRVVFRPTETEQVALQAGPDPEAVFRMLLHPQRDIFEFEGGRQLAVNQLPSGLVMDVLVVPGQEQLSTLVTQAVRPAREPEPARGERSALARLLHIG